MGELKMVEKNDTEFGGGDGGGGYSSIIKSLEIKFVSNGVVLSFISEDGDRLEEIYPELEDALNRISLTVGGGYEE